MHVFISTHILNTSSWKHSQSHRQVGQSLGRKVESWNRMFITPHCSVICKQMHFSMTWLTLHRPRLPVYKARYVCMDPDCCWVSEVQCDPIITHSYIIKNTLAHQWEQYTVICEMEFLIFVFLSHYIAYMTSSHISNISANGWKKGNSNLDPVLSCIYMGMLLKRLPIQLRCIPAIAPCLCLSE